MLKIGKLLLKYFWRSQTKNKRIRKVKRKKKSEKDKKTKTYMKEYLK